MYNQPVQATKTYTSQEYVKGVGLLVDEHKEKTPSFHTIYFAPEMLTFVK